MRLLLAALAFQGNVMFVNDNRRAAAEARSDKPPRFMRLGFGMRDLPIACALNPFELFARHDTLLPGVIARAECSELLPNGARWRFKPSNELLLALAAMIDAERRCCPFLRFQVVVEEDNGPVWLDVTGPEGTREFLERLPHP